MADKAFPLTSETQNSAEDHTLSEEFDTCDQEFEQLLKEQRNDYEDDYHSSGFGFVMAAIFIVSVVAGSGILILPVAMADTGWYGLIIVFVIATTMAYTGILLGRCWIILQERFECYRHQTRYPFAAIGYESFGPVGRFTVTVLVDVTLFGIGVAFLLIISQNIEILLQSQYLEVCSILPLVATALCPLVWFGTPKDFWPIAVGGAVTTGLASILLLISILSDNTGSNTKNSGVSQEVLVESSPPSVWSITTGFGLITVTMFGHPAYPTIQHDMRNPAKFSWSVLLSYIIIGFYFLPLTVVGYYVYGDKLLGEDSVFEVLYPSLAKTVALVLITFHVVCSFVVTLNPVFQEIEEFIGIETTLTWKRVVIRTLNVAFILFLAASIPNFSKVLSILSGTVMTTLSFIVPCVLYIKLCTMQSPRWPDRSLSLLGYLRLSIIIIASTAAAIMVTLANFKSADSSVDEYFTFTKPCFIPG